MRSSSPAIGGSGGSAARGGNPDEAVVDLQSSAPSRVASCVRAPELSRHATPPAPTVFATQTEPPPAEIRSGSGPAGTACWTPRSCLAQLVDLVLADDRDPDRAAADRQVADRRVQLRVRTVIALPTGSIFQTEPSVLAAQTAPSA